jgi:hypothetical protein
MTDVEVETAISLRNRRDAVYASDNACRMLRTRHGKQRQACWSEGDQNAMIDTCLRGWKCPPIYLITRTDLTGECDQGEDHVFDGAHKLEAVFDFIDGKFAFRADRRFAELDGKRFSEMPRDVQERIKKYRFHINHIDEETAGDPDELRILWERVNKAGVRLNAYELEIPVIEELIQKVLRPVGKGYMGSVLFPKSESKRGNLEQILQIILAVHDLSDDAAFSSQNALVRNWHVAHLGSTMVERVANVEKNGSMWTDVLGRCQKMMADLDQLNVFRNAETGAVDVADALLKTELPFVLARFARRFPRIEDFRSRKVEIAARLRAEIFSKTALQMMGEMEVRGRNGTYQRKLMRLVDGVAVAMAEQVQRRLFTAKQKEAKLREQGGNCVACAKPVLAHQLADGDHVVAWSEGGATTAENLQILHRHCHQVKTAAAAGGGR